MLALFRNNIKWIGWSIVIAFALTMFAGTFWGGGVSSRSASTSSPELSTDYVALVGSIPVSGQKFYGFFSEVQTASMESDQHRKPTPEMLMERYYYAFQRAMEFSILLQHARATDLEVGRSEYQSYLQQVMRGLGITRKSELRKKLADNGLNYEAYKVRLEDNIRVQKIQKTLNQVSISDQDIINYYTELLASHILIPINPDQPDEARSQIETIRDDILRGNLSFTQAASQYSADPSNAQKGGDLGWIRYHSVVAPFADAAYALDKGALSEPVKTQFGWHLIKVEDSRPTKVIEPDAFASERQTVAQARAQYNKNQLLVDVAGDSPLIIVNPLLKGVHAIKTGVYTDAIQGFEASISQDPDSPIPHYFLAKLYAEKDQHDLAESEWKKAGLKADLMQETSPWPSVYVGQGQYYAEQGQRTKMKAAYAKALDLGKTDLNTLDALADAYTEAGMVAKFNAVDQQRQDLQAALKADADADASLIPDSE